MRHLITGLDASGHSSATAFTELEASEGSDGFKLTSIHETVSSPPPQRPAGRAEYVDMRLEPGLLRWAACEFPPGAEFRMHHTDTVDLHWVVSGACELILDDGAHRLEAGDTAIVTGVDHGWRIGAEGCVLNSVVVGTAPHA